MTTERARPDLGSALGDLQTTVDALLDPPGCEWNRAQTHRSLVTYLVEETYELVEAIEDGGPEDLREELGDVLYQVVLHAGIAERAGEGFGLAEVMREVDEKIRRRHPHVFGDESAADVDDIVRLWSAAKAREKAARQSAYDGVAGPLPALARAQKIRSRRVSSTGSAGSTPSPDRDTSLSGAETELAWGRALLAEVEIASSRGLDAERSLRLAVRERESQLRQAEAAAENERERDGGAPHNPNTGDPARPE